MVASLKRPEWQPAARHVLLPVLSLFCCCFVFVVARIVVAVVAGVAGVAHLHSA